MRKQAFYELLRKCREVEGFGLNELEKLLSDHPYFSTGYILKAMIRKEQEHLDAENAIRQAAAYAGDRRVLYDLLHGGYRSPDNDETPIEDVGRVEAHPRIENSGISRKEIPAEPTEEPAEMKLPEEKKKTSKHKKKSSPKPKPKGTPGTSNKKKTVPPVGKHSFVGWLKMAGKQDQAGKIPAGEVSRDPQKSKHELNWGLLDKFLENDVTIRPKKQFREKDDERSDVSQDSTAEHDEFMTETLAKIHEGQGHLDKAIEIYRKLSLKYPGKSSYFAALIEDLKKKKT